MSWGSERAKRSSFQTMTTSPFRALSRSRINSSRSVLAPEDLFLVNARALDAFEGVLLQIGFLGIGRDASVADFHGAKISKGSLLCHLNFCTIVVN
jgi:hypothetical protein